MSSSPPEADPYLELGLSRNATLAEIRASHRKRVLKCHPDKITDEAIRRVALDEFQRVQYAYEILSDETRRERYDQRVRLAAIAQEKRDLLKKKQAEVSARGSGASSREFRDGHIVEERVPFDSNYFEETRIYEEPRVYEEPRSSSRKADAYVKRPKAKEEKKKASNPTMSSERAAKESRDSTKASHSERQRRRDKERRGQQSEKYETFSPFVVSDHSSSDSSDSEIHYRKTTRHARESRPRPTESSRRREPEYYEEEEIHDRPRYEANLNRAEEHIERSKEHIERSKYENYRTRASPHRSRGYDSPEPETRRSGRSSRANHNRSSSRHDSFEDLEPRYERPKMPTSTTMPGSKSTLRPSLFGGSRSSSAFVRPKRGESSSRGDVLSKMAAEPIPSRSSKSREKYDSGYSSPSTPEVNLKTSSPKVTARYVVETPAASAASPRTRQHRTMSTDERPREHTRMTPKRSSTYQPSSTKEQQSPNIKIRSVRPNRTYDNVEFAPYIRDEDIKYTEIRPGEPTMSQGRTYYYTDHIRPRRTAAGTA
ncbi:hypothetical protein N7478_004472 [Penicillium angulare]|uniref:uncharacterized protein n=1 Tax=Penicillium angulare TaxID=116970 RepID=UPI0025414A78|nr:uncharacterized protein N7478_004472 [Penicillium angulare]KAJ5279100.1 hypothetical protein N7478_004472 [Penicillium angulare]